MQLLDEVRSHCRAIAERPAASTIDLDAAARARRPRRATRGAHLGRPPTSDSLLQLDAINFGSGWFPTLRKRPGLLGLPRSPRGRASREHGPWPTPSCARSTRRAVAAALGQDPRHPLMRLYARGAARPRPLPRRARGARPGRRGAGGSAERLADAARARHALLRRPRLLQARADRAERPGAGRRRRVRRPRPAHDLRRQPRPARAARGRRAALRPRAGGPHRRRRAAAAGRGPSARSAPARCTPASGSPSGPACRRACSTCGSGTAGRRRTTRRSRGTARARVYY